LSENGDHYIGPCEAGASHGCKKTSTLWGAARAQRKNDEEKSDKSKDPILRRTSLGPRFDDPASTRCRPKVTLLKNQFLIDDLLSMKR
jgi:hypothetical protein